MNNLVNENTCIVYANTYTNGLDRSNVLSVLSLPDDVNQINMFKDKVSFHSSERKWKEWNEEIHKTLNLLNNSDIKKLILLGSCPMSTMMYIGLNSIRKYFYTTIINYNNFTKQNELWEIDNNFSIVDDNKYVFNDMSCDTYKYLSDYSNSKLVLFLSLNPSYTLDETKVNQIEQELKEHGNSELINVTNVCNLKCKNNTIVSSDDVPNIKREFDLFIKKYTQCVKHSGFVVVSTLPNPLNYLFGSMLHTHMYGSLTFMEFVKGSYKVTWSNIT